VIFNENASRIRNGLAPAIMTAIRHCCVQLLEKEGSSLSMVHKRRKAAWDDDYRAKVLAA